MKYLENNSLLISIGIKRIRESSLIQHAHFSLTSLLNLMTHSTEGKPKLTKESDAMHITVQKLKPRPGVYSVFGGGLRYCPGSNFARLQVMMFLHHVCLKYR